MNFISKLLNYLKNPLRIILYLDNHNLIHLKDENYLKIDYRSYMKKKLNLDNPKTFNEKLQWLKINDKNDLYTELVDKYEVKKYVEKKIGKKYIIPTIGIYDNFDLINFDILPNQFVIKCTHDSGGLVICKDKKNFDIDSARKYINKRLRFNYYKMHREWPYKNIKPRIIVEKYMEDSSGELTDYKMMCFNGKMKFSFVCTDRFNNKGLKITFFDKNWKKMPFERHYPKADYEIKCPINYKKMIELSEKLSKDIPFLRVDFYEVNGKVFFGEMTFFPGSGYEEFKPEKWDEKIGNMIKIKK